LADGTTRVIHTLDITGPGADQVGPQLGPQLGPQIGGDFPVTLAEVLCAAEHGVAGTYRRRSDDAAQPSPARRAPHRAVPCWDTAMMSDLRSEFSHEKHSPGLAPWRVTNAAGTSGSRTSPTATSVRFVAPLESMTHGRGSYLVIRVPAEESDFLNSLGVQRVGFRGIRVAAVMGRTRWPTTIFPDGPDFILLIARHRASGERLKVGDPVSIRLDIR
jgi:hypothetical protein